MQLGQTAETHSIRQLKAGYYNLFRTVEKRF